MSMASGLDADLTRVTPVGGCLNFRHLGGYLAAGGRLTRADLLFRSGWLQLDGAGETESFRTRRVRRVIDFRNEAEAAAKPFALPELGQADVISLPIQHGSMAGFLQSLAAGSTSPADARRAMASMYREMTDLGAPQFRELFQQALKADGALLLACSLGKDRTGVASALLLAALGVSEADIFADFMISDLVYGSRSEGLYQAMNFQARGMPLERVRDVLTVHPDYLAAAWDEIKRQHASISNYLRSRLGLEDAACERLQEKFTQ